MIRSYSDVTLQQVTKKIAQQFQPEQIILFGSRAWGKANPDSDVDLLIIKDTQKSTRELARQIDGTIFPRPFSLDIIVHTPQQIKRRQAIGDFFITDILTKGKTLYDKRSAKSLFS
jgi:uncharacterized protein